MNDPVINRYGDRRIAQAEGHGADIASQRLDPLDRLALAEIERCWHETPARAPRALELGCGAGGLAVRLAQAGADYTGVDRIDFTADFARLAETLTPACRGRLCFVQGDFSALPESLLATLAGQVSLLIAQRCLHYLPYPSALASLRDLGHLLVPDARVYIGVSGLASELSLGYPAARQPLTVRFGRLGSDMAVRHAIEAPVCLYRPDELRQLLENAGYEVLKLFSSPFGNVKAVAMPSPRPGRNGAEGGRQVSAADLPARP